MSTFSQLPANPTSRPPEIVQVESRDRFSNRLASSHLVERKPDSPIGDGVFIVLGVATYSPQDLTLLDEIEMRYSEWSKHDIQIEVFDVLRCRSHEDFRKYIPQLGDDVYQSPVIACWKNGKLDVVKTGVDASRAILKQHGVL